MRDSIDYDALGNVRFVQTPRGVRFRSYSHRDALGRDTLIVSPVDTAGSYALTHRVWYDLADQDTLSRTDVGRFAWRRDGAASSESHSSDTLAS